ncbi:MAG: UDP-glucose--hexose-1-phosphate uridylyltransferase [Beduini sp.]|uniref:UDP-glucose--hexose-1-phosphate uridylyltransferase n=1 Tax=Beduini sp. TaxID=1922300 RepID=UPI0039A08BE3
MNHEINRLLNFALQQQLIAETDFDYAANLLMDVLKLNEFQKEEINEHLTECTPILKILLDEACQRGLIEDDTTHRDLFDTRIMNCLMPRPSEVIERFYSLYSIKGPKAATDAYYQLSIASNYIRKSRVDKNMKWVANSPYGDIQISINLSKPEKDPKEIEKAKLIKSIDYPKCLLCKENVGFAGDLKKNARQTHRIIPMKLDEDHYYLQYSPYVYYNEHCIVFNEQHLPMKINGQTFSHLLAFLDVLPHYFIGSNADLPIVGGSILSHDHFQGGCHHFPIETAKVLAEYSFKAYPAVKAEIIEWPLSTLRLTSKNKAELLKLSEHILAVWQYYSDESVDIIAFSEGVPHNTITPIARKVGDFYQLDLVFRNNRCNDMYPDGIFHPHPAVHHIKKENIGLIEVMGLAILPARLVKEMQYVEEALLQERAMDDPILGTHQEWVSAIAKVHTYTKENVKEKIQEEIGKVFVEVLKDAGVFKLNKEGIEAFKRFVSNLG